MLNRNIAPEVKTGTELILRKPQKSVLSNGIPVYTFNLTEQDLIKIDFVFQAGSIYHQNPLIPEAANSLIESGTQLFTSAQIAEKFDFHGAYLDLLMGKHMAQLSLYTLNKYLEETLSLTKELLLNAVYPSHEIDIWLQNKYNSYLINRSKSDIISSEVFAETLFGEEHPYGRHIQDFHFKEFQKEDVSAFFKQYYNPASLTVFLSGKVEDTQLKLINKLLSSIPFVQSIDDNDIDFSIKISQKSEVLIPVANSVQSSISAGMLTIKRTDPDYRKLHITTTILGGYFGSRLMANIREDKGYTYGIYASLMSLPKSGIFSINAQSSKDVYKDAIKEIKKEIDILRNERISDHELRRVKRYISGSLARTFDGAFALADVFKSLLLFDLNFDYYESYFKTLQTIQADEILETAQRYLNYENMSFVIAGDL
jgi:zinc protease